MNFRCKLPLLWLTLFGFLLIISLSCNGDEELTTEQFICAGKTEEPIDGRYIFELNDSIVINDREDFKQLTPVMIQYLQDSFSITGPITLELVKPCACRFILVDATFSGVGIEEKEAAAHTDEEDEGTIIKNIGKDRFIELDLPVDVPEAPIDTVSHDMNNAPDADPVVRVAIVDTGVDSDLPEFDNKIWTNPGETMMDKDDNEGNCLIDDYYGFNFLKLFELPDSSNPDQYDPHDIYGHGTHINGIIASDIPAGSPLLLMNQKALEKGESNLFEAVCGIYDAVDKGAKIINLSWGYYGEMSNMLRGAIRYAQKNNVLVVTSAGNRGINVDDCEHWPSGFSTLYDNVISVAALDVFNNCSDVPEIVDFSNYGNKIDLAAPGTEISSTWPTDMGMGTTQMMSGTSMAAGYVTRQAYIVLKGSPTLTAHEVKLEILNNYCEDLSPQSSGKFIRPHGPGNVMKWMRPSGTVGYCN